jgi:hypothetical protein
MAESQWKTFVNHLAAGAMWDGIKYLASQLWGPLVLAGVVAVWQKAKHGSLDWFAIGGIFVIASILVFLSFRKPKVSVPAIDLPTPVEPLDIQIDKMAAANAATAPQAGATNADVVPNITMVSHEVTYDPAGGVSYPLKLRIYFRNDSPTIAAAVRVANFAQTSSIPVQRPTPIRTLQFNLEDGKWWPEQHGREYLAVLPGQQFRTWVSFDDKQTNKTQLDLTAGRLGKITLLANGHRMDFQV